MAKPPIVSDHERVHHEFFGGTVAENSMIE